MSESLNPGIEVEDSRLAGPVTQEFAALLLRAAAAYENTEGADPLLPQIIKGCIMTGNLDALDQDDLQTVFSGAGFYFERIVVEPLIDRLPLTD